MSSGQFWDKVCLQAVRSKRGVAAASAFTSGLVQDPEPRNPGTPPGRQSGHPDARGRHELHAARGSAGAAALGGRRAPGPAGRKAEVSGLSSHASTSAGKRPAPCADLGDSRLASRETPRSPPARPALHVRGGERRPGGAARRGRDHRSLSGCVPLFPAPTSAWDPCELPEPLPAAQGRGNRGRQLRVGQGCSVEALTPAGPRPATPGRVAIAAGLLRTLTPAASGLAPYLAPGPGASSSRGRRGPACGEGRGGGRGSRGLRPARLPRFPPESGVEHSASPPAPMRKTVTATAPPTSERGTAGPPCLRATRPPARPQRRSARQRGGGGRSGSQAAPRGHLAPRALGPSQAAAPLRPHPIPRGRGERGCASASLCAFPSF